MRTLHCIFLLVLLVGCSTTQGIIGRWERPDGSSPMIFAKDGKCEVGFGSPKDGRWPMIPGTYTVSPEGKVSLVAKGNGVTLTEFYYFEGDRLTDGVVFFGEGKRYWHKTSRR